MDLLQEFKPIFYHDKNEQIKVCNADSFFNGGQVINDNTILGHLIERNNKKYLYYYLSYYKDGGKKVLCFDIDSHNDDIEGLVIELNETNCVSGICYRPHSTKENFWIRDQDDLNKIFDKKKTKVYISNGKHAMYPIPNVYRYFGFANDICSNPKSCDYFVKPLTNFLLTTRNFKDSFIGFPKRLNEDLSLIEEIRLEDLKTKTLFKKFW